jgi:hypothetical protein
LSFAALTLAAVASISDTSVPFGKLTGRKVPSRMARRAAKYLGTSIFLIRLIAAPLVPLFALRMLVLIDESNPEDMKSRLRRLYQTYTDRGGLADEVAYFTDARRGIE